MVFKGSSVNLQRHGDEMLQQSFIEKFIKNGILAGADSSPDFKTVERSGLLYHFFPACVLFAFCCKEFIWVQLRE